MAVIGGRQVAPSVGGIRADHVNRYRWVLSDIQDNPDILDCACGVGYGSFILSEKAKSVTGVDIDHVAVDYAKTFYKVPKTEYVVSDAIDFLRKSDKIFSAIVSFETIEHVLEDDLLLYLFSKKSRVLYASVPNESVVPHDPVRNPYHVRHYTAEEFETKLARAGWSPRLWMTQHGKQGPVVPGDDGETLIVKAISLDV